METCKILNSNEWQVICNCKNSSSDHLGSYVHNSNLLHAKRPSPGHPSAADEVWYWPKCILRSGWLCMSSRPIVWGSCGLLIFHAKWIYVYSYQIQLGFEAFCIVNMERLCFVTSWMRVSVLVQRGMIWSKLVSFPDPQQDPYVGLGMRLGLSL